MLKFLLLMSSVSFLSTAYAVDFSKQYTFCMDKSEGITSNMLNCMSDETKRQDERLNRAYKLLMSEQSPERKKQLQDAQRLWIKFRDANCNFYYDPDGGTMATVSGSSCFLEYTGYRAKELEDLKSPL